MALAHADGDGLFVLLVPRPCAGLVPGAARAAHRDPLTPASADVRATGVFQSKAGSNVTEVTKRWGDSSRAAERAGGAPSRPRLV